ncbi:DUF6348 family protein [uncultured Cardiobacterium sp.]|uniref:DUF6348 family protein n=1 Tax=uncultured Cardiobacterium sp. TaxID=417619 RepID=UPI00261AC8A9|nr:DUF6348 family protein [uncultured Cardiobacterium sp.]
MNYDDGSADNWDLPALLADALAAEGCPTTRHGDWLYHAASGYALLVQIAALDFGERVRSTITIQIHHPELFPQGIFEYQHSFGADPAEALHYGLEWWLTGDWQLLHAVATNDDKGHTGMSMTFPDGRIRRVHFGATQYWQENPAPAPADGEDDAHQPFCPCCLFTNSMEAFKPLLEGHDNYALRLFASRNDDGSTDADCRVNGEDYAPGMDALRAYAATWPGTGSEFRKQYVLITND